MTFMEQRVKQSMLTCYLKEHDHPNSSFKNSSLALKTSLLNEHGQMQDTFVPHDSDCKSKCTIFNGPVNTPESSSNIPHWMSPKHEPEFQVRSSASNVLVSSRAIGRPQCLKETLHSHSQECTEPLLFPSTGTEEANRLNDLGVALQLSAHSVNSEHSLQKLVPSTSLGFKPLEAPSREEQGDSRVDLLSFLFKKQQKQLVEGALEVLPGLATGHDGLSGLHKKSDANSWVSKFPFQIDPDMDIGQSIDFEVSSMQRQPLEHDKGLISMRTCALQSAGTKKHIDQSSFLIQHSSSLAGAVQSCLIQESADNTTSKCALTSLGSGMPYLKHDWNTALMQCVKFPQTLPDFFAQQKVMTSARANIFGNPERYLDINRNGVIPQKDFSARLGGETAERDGNSTNIHRRISQQLLPCGTLAEEKLCHILCPKINAPDVNIQALTVAFEASQCDQLASMEALHANCKTDVSEGKHCHSAFRAVARRQVSCVDLDVNKPANDVQAIEFVPSEECTSTTDMPGDSLQALATDSLCACAEKSQGLEKANMIPEGDWGQFLANSKMREVTDSHVKILLPFEQRFKQLQEFLKKCDHSDVQYCQQASHMLSASAQGNHAVELESRALRLSVQEGACYFYRVWNLVAVDYPCNSRCILSGKEMKRAKLLNMLDEGPERPFLAVYT